MDTQDFYTVAKNLHDVNTEKDEATNPKPLSGQQAVQTPKSITPTQQNEKENVATEVTIKKEGEGFVLQEEEKEVPSPHPAAVLLFARHFCCSHRAVDRCGESADRFRQRRTAVRGEYEEARRVHCRAV